MTALVDRLVAADFVERVAVPGDRRATAVALRPATWVAFARVYRPLGRRVRSTVDVLPVAEQAAMSASLDLLSRAFRDARAHLVDGE